jgi:hypothetical protein
MSGTQVQSIATIGQIVIATNCSVAETGDFNSDGKSDILWIDTPGDVAVWFMNGAQIISSARYGNVGAG